LFWKRGRALREERVHALGAIGAREHQAERVLFERVGGTQIGVLPFLHHALRKRDREGPLARNLLADRERRLEQRLGWEDAVGEADAQRRLRVDRLPSEHQFVRPGDAHAAHHAAGAAEAGQHAEVHFGWPKRALVDA